MSEKDLHAMSDAELLDEAKRLRYVPVTHAVIIGFLVGVVFYSLVNNSFGWLMCIPLYLIHRFVNAPNAKRLKEVKELIEKKNLK